MAKIVYYESCTWSPADVQRAVGGKIQHNDSRFWKSSGIPFKNEQERSEQEVSAVVVVHGSTFQAEIIAAYGVATGERSATKVEVVTMPTDAVKLTGRPAYKKREAAEAMVAGKDRELALEARIVELEAAEKREAQGEGEVAGAAKVAELEARIAEFEAREAAAADAPATGVREVPLVPEAPAG